MNKHKKNKESLNEILIMYNQLNWVLDKVGRVDSSFRSVLLSVSLLG